jgi:hypothetical protein
MKRRASLLLIVTFLLTVSSCIVMKMPLGAASSLPPNNENNTSPVKTTESANSSSSATHENNLKKYQGAWFAEDYTKVDAGKGTLVPAGAEMVLNISDTGEDNSIRLILTSLPPASRIAVVEAKIIMKDSQTGSFNFDDDGWGTKGNGIIQFQGDKVTVTIQRLSSTDTNWRIFGGTKIFIRM